METATHEAHYRPAARIPVSRHACAAVPSAGDRPSPPLRADRAVASTMPTSAPRRPTAIHPITAGQPANISHHAACI